jgi:hypothetical protein
VDKVQYIKKYNYLRYNDKIYIPNSAIQKVSSRSHEYLLHLS